MKYGSSECKELDKSERKSGERVRKGLHCHPCQCGVDQSITNLDVPRNELACPCKENLRILCFNLTEFQSKTDI